MAKRQNTPREFILVNEQSIIDAQQLPDFYTLYLREIFVSLERRGLITTMQRNDVLISIDTIKRKLG